MSETTKAFTITPQTKIGELLTVYPAAEPILDELVPTFGKLKPGIFRETIARTTTLEQAASASRVRLPDLIIKLRKITGANGEDKNVTNLPGRPLWVEEGVVAKELDARPLLAQGVHPKELVMSEVNALQNGQMFVLLTPFVPGPLIEIARSQGYQTWTKQSETGKVETYFGKG